MLSGISSGHSKRGPTSALTKSLSDYSVRQTGERRLLQRLYTAVSKVARHAKRVMAMKPRTHIEATPPQQHRSGKRNLSSNDLPVLGDGSSSTLLVPMPLLAPQAVPTAFEGLLNSGLLDMPDTSSAPDTLNKCQSWIDSASFLTPLAIHIKAQRPVTPLLESGLPSTIHSSRSHQSGILDDTAAYQISSMGHDTQYHATVSNEHSIHLSSLPAEIICNIAMRAGFFGALLLSQASSRLHVLLSSPSSWVSYKLLTSDHITNTITVVTKVHTFDHLVFGDWHAHSSISDSNKDKDDAEPDVFFMHRTFLEQFDFLGGISFRMDPGGLATANFFEHREHLSCYIDDMQLRVQNGIVPPPLAPYTAPPSPPPPSIVSATTPTEENALESLMPLPIHTSPTGGARIQHSCPSCEYYDTQKVRRSIFVFDQVPLHPTWAKDGVTYQHAYKDSKRTLLVTVKPSSGRMFQDDLPVVTLNRLEINGTKLNPNYYSLFLKLVHQR
ncbi:hypothetical protein BASA50_002505 [Batrachochytrium salamandrivorans]|uniref:F-box domain-containing protein n=1 Tax=Batrachochytrium salamandrivorans TaxID=1357716 RepID=A0ABQ8FL52_9FUNG|nr:hypothetical protein BASA60_001981 [Batrachochytrium salamandrivorans]KAH6600180.1 hypothetical protein BASA50_002505 [Batrachochytrium salamandrivorans]